MTNDPSPQEAELTHTHAMVVVGCVPTMGVAMAAVGGVLAVAMAFVFRFDFPIFYTVEAPVVIVGCC